jgi:hypothetical protein
MCVSLWAVLYYVCCGLSGFPLRPTVQPCWVRVCSCHSFIACQLVLGASVLPSSACMCISSTVLLTLRTGPAHQPVQGVYTCFRHSVLLYTRATRLQAIQAAIMHMHVRGSGSNMTCVVWCGASLACWCCACWCPCNLLGASCMQYGVLACVPLLSVCLCDSGIIWLS